MWHHSQVLPHHVAFFISHQFSAHPQESRVSYFSPWFLFKCVSEASFLGAFLLCLFISWRPLSWAGATFSLSIFIFPSPKLFPVQRFRLGCVSWWSCGFSQIMDGEGKVGDGKIFPFFFGCGGWGKVFFLVSLSLSPCIRSFSLLVLWRSWGLLSWGVRRQPGRAFLWWVGGWEGVFTTPCGTPEKRPLTTTMWPGKMYFFSGCC